MKRLPIIALMLISVWGYSATSHGFSVSFTDSNRYWGDGTGWGSKWNTDVANGQWDGNKIDVIGNPNITGGTVNFNSTGNLTSIRFNYSADDWRMLAPGNLFINVLNSANDTTWDYVVATMGNASLNKNNQTIPTLAAGNFGLYSISLDAKRGINDSGYILSGADNTGPWAGYYVRNGHPIGVQQTALGGYQGQVGFSGFPGTQDGSYWNRFSIYDFGDGLDLHGKDIIIGWEMTCANDVVYEQINNPVPEPSTFFLLGIGLAGLGLYGRKKFKM